MKTLHVYILTCADGSFYSGVSNDVVTRFEQHCLGLNKDCYTYSRRPLLLSWQSEPLESIYAIAFEKKLKGWTHAKKQALIDGDYDALIRLSKKKFNK